MSVDCHWNAGADRYLGTVPAAIAAYHLPIATQQALIEKWERRQFADVVTIDRDSIRGRAGDYEPELRGMNFGGAGRVCDRVSRAGWSADHVETAIVLCADGECVAVPSICLNVSRIVRRGLLAPFLPPGAGSPDEPLGAPIGVGPYLTPADLPLASPAPDAGPWSSAWLPGGFGGYGSIVVTTCECCVPGSVPAVAEPKEWALLLSGIGALWMFRRKGSKWHR